MSTYAEKNSEWVYDWPQIIVDIMNDEYDEDQLYEVMGAAGSWVTCACGNQCDIILRNRDGKPISRTDMSKHLQELVCLLELRGSKFCGDISDLIEAPSAEHAAGAMGTLAQIEFLAGLIIPEMKKRG